MSLGLQFIRACIEHSSRVTFASLSPVQMNDDAERGAFEFVTDFLRQYDRFPSVDVVERHGFPLPAATDPLDYYVSRLGVRYRWMLVNERNTEMSDAFKHRDMDRFEQVITELQNDFRNVRRVNDVETLHELSQQVIEEYNRAHMRPGRQGITLGWQPMDRLTGGAEGGDIVTLVARPNKGKSWLLAHMARAAWRAGRSVLLVTMEMTGRQMARRIIGLDAGMNPNYIRQGTLSTWGFNSMLQTVEDIRTGAPFHMIQGSFNKSLDAVDQAMHEFGPDIVFIDASYLMAPSRRAGGKQKQHEILAAVGTEMKEMAMARNRPFVQTVQFNREAERAEERTLAHIGGTDVVGQISTIVVGIQEGPMPSPESSRLLSILKNRENPLGEFTTHFLFNPPNFGFRPPEDIAPEDNGGVEAEWSI